MEKAPIERQLVFDGFESVSAGIVKWPMSVIRLSSADKPSLLGLATKILEKWRSYSDDSVQIKAETDGTPHHTITPIARKRGDLYELDLVLRDNQTSEEFPDGIYHPHPDVQHIKKENIGLIEVMGLAILPPRLKAELAEVEKFLLGQDSQVADYHQPWAESLKTAHPDVTEETVEQVVRESVGQILRVYWKMQGFTNALQKDRHLSTLCGVCRFSNINVRKSGTVSCSFGIMKVFTV